MRQAELISTTRRISILLALIAAVFVAGCDSNEDDDTGDGDDADRLVGVWEATSATAGSLDLLTIAGVEMTVVFEADGDASITVTDEGGDDTGITGTYSIDTGAGTITMDGDNVEEDLVLDYTFVDDNNLEVSFAGSDLENIGIDLGTVGELLGEFTVNVELEKTAT